MGKAVRLSTVLLVWVLAVESCSAQDLASKADEYLKAHVKTGRFSGSVLIARAGKPLFSMGYGMANLEHDVPNTAQTKFRLGSITKQFTAAAILQLEERGKLSVQDPVCKYVEECPSAWQKVTIHNLLTHTSGIPNMTSFPEYRKTWMLPSRPNETILRFKDKPLDFEPGEKFSYSNSGYVLLAVILEKATGGPFERYLKENIFDPVGMTNSGHDSHDAILKHRATGYTMSRGELVNSAYHDMTIPIGGGDLYSTVEDMLLWDQALYTEKVLSKKSLDKVFTSFKSNYGYGWMVTQQFNRQQIGHGGGINGFSTAFNRYPEDRTCIVVLANMDFAATGRIARDLAAIVYGEKYEIPKERVAIQVDPKIYEAYVGKYELRPGFVMTVTRDGYRLMTQLTGQQVVEVFPETENKFFLKVVDAQLTFVKGENGQVTHLILHQGGRDQKAGRVP